MGQNRIRGGWGVKNLRKSSDIIYVRSLRNKHEIMTHEFTKRMFTLVGVRAKQQYFREYHLELSTASSIAVKKSQSVELS